MLLETGKTQVFAGKVNLTLQSAAKIICGSLNELSRNGVAIPGDVSAPWLQDIIYIYTFCLTCTSVFAKHCPLNFQIFFITSQLTTLI
jgi:hypothetical protein